MSQGKIITDKELRDRFYAASSVYELHRLFDTNQMQAFITLNTLSPKEVDRLFDKKVIYVLKEEFK